MAQRPFSMDNQQSLLHTAIQRIRNLETGCFVFSYISGCRTPQGVTLSWSNLE